MSADLSINVLWRAPVLLRRGHGSSERIEGPSVALHYLNHRWPHERGPFYMTALDCCEAALRGIISDEVAKETFILAAIESRLLASTQE
jgi:hypothetical protein